MKKGMKKVVLLLVIVLLVVTVEGRMKTQAAISKQAGQTVSCMALSGREKRMESNAKICGLDDRMISASSLGKSNLALHKRNTPSPTPASKKSSEEEDNYGLGGFVILVILAVLWFRSQKKKNTIYVKRK